MILFLRALLFIPYFTFISALFCIVVIIRPYYRNATCLFGRCIGRPCLFILGIKLEVEGSMSSESRPSIIIVNHQHNIDLIIAAAIFKKNTVSIGKNSILYIPFFGFFYKYAGNILVDRTNAKKAMRAINQIGKKIIERSISVCVFPEGTRNTTDTLLQFKRGAFISAIEAKAPIIPIAIERYALRHNLNSFKTTTVKLHILESIETSHLEKSDAKELAQQCQELLESKITSF